MLGPPWGSACQGLGTVLEGSSTGGSLLGSTCSRAAVLALRTQGSLAPLLSIPTPTPFSFGSEQTPAKGGGVAGGECALHNPVQDLAPPGSGGSSDRGEAAANSAPRTLGCPAPRTQQRRFSAGPTARDARLGACGRGQPASPRPPLLAAGAVRPCLSAQPDPRPEMTS